MSKEELTRALRDASDLEESVMGFLTRFVEMYFDWSGFPQEKVRTAKELIRKMNADSEKHDKMIESMLSWVSERRENEF